MCMLINIRMIYTYNKLVYQYVSICGKMLFVTSKIYHKIRQKYSIYDDRS